MFKLPDTGPFALDVHVKVNDEWMLFPDEACVSLFRTPINQVLSFRGKAGVATAVRFECPNMAEEGALDLIRYITTCPQYGRLPTYLGDGVLQFSGSATDVRLMVNAARSFINISEFELPGPLFAQLLRDGAAPDAAYLAVCSYQMQSDEGYLMRTWSHAAGPLLDAGAGRVREQLNQWRNKAPDAGKSFNTHEYTTISNYIAEEGGGSKSTTYEELLSLLIAVTKE